MHTFVSSILLIRGLLTTASAQYPARIDVNGVLSGVSTNPGAPLAIKTPARLWMGGWYHNCDFVGDTVLTLKLKEPSTATKITYLKEIAWNQDTLLNGANGLAALTFCNVPLSLR